MIPVSTDLTTLTLASLLLLAAGGGYAEEKLSRQEVDHQFGTDPSFTHYPVSAIDTDDVPNIVLNAGDSDNAPLHSYKVADNTYMLFGNIAEVDEFNRGWNGNAGFVVTDAGVVVIDALGTPKLGRRLIATIRMVTDLPIKYLILTHNHPDHAYGAAAFRNLNGVTVIGHEGTLGYLNSNAIEQSVAYRKTFIAADMQDFAPVKPDLLLGGEPFSKHRLVLGGQTFDVYNTGAHHSYGDLLVHQVDAGIVWISDLAFNQRVTFMADGSSQVAIAGQDWLLQHFADAKLMIPGHGSAQTPPFPMVIQTRSYMQRLRTSMAQAIKNDLDIQKAIDQGDLKEWQDVRLYHLNHRKNLNFVYREMEENLF